MVALVVTMPTLIFGVGLPYFVSLIATLILGFVLGFALKLKGWWYVVVVAAAVLTTVFVGIGALLVSLIA